MSKRQIILLVVIAIVWFLFRVVSTVPASLVFSKVNEKLAPRAVIVNPQGSIWSGQADRLAINAGPAGAINFEGLSWELHAWRLLLGQVALDIKTIPSAQSINANIVVSILGKIQLNDVDAELDAALISKSFPMPADVQGNVHIKSNAIHIKDKQLVKLADNSEFRWLKAGFNFNQNVFLGDYLGKLKQAPNGAIEITLSDLDALLKVDGKITAQMSQPLKYDVDILVEPNKEFPEDLKNMLSMMGPANAQGQYRIKRSQ